MLNYRRYLARCSVEIWVDIVESLGFFLSRQFSIVIEENLFCMAQLQRGSPRVLKLCEMIAGATMP